jgi:hypothetical protein
MLGFGSNSSIPTTGDVAEYKKSHDFLISPRSSLLVKLKSGQQISYAEAGDKHGHPAIWIGGPNTNRFIIGLYDSLATEMGLRLLCFDRPGRGASTPLKYPKEWAFDSWGRKIF